MNLLDFFPGVGLRSRQSRAFHRSDLQGAAGDVCVAVESVRKALGSTLVLRDATLSLRVGETCLLQGRNGCGKSTFLACMAGLFPVDSGTIRIGNPPTDPARVAAKRLIGYAPDIHPIDLKLNVREYLWLIGGLHGLDRLGLEGRLEELSNDLALTEILCVPLEHCSHGMTKRVAVAAAMLHDPTLLLLDEPEAGLDPLAEAGLIEALRRTVRAGTTLLVATHRPTLYEPFSPRVVTLVTGEIQEQQQARRRTP